MAWHDATALDVVQVNEGDQMRALFRFWAAPMALLAAVALQSFPAAATGTPAEIWVDTHGGKDAARGTKRRPLRTLTAALDRLPEQIERTVTIHLAAGTYREKKVLTGSLVLDRRMGEGVRVRLLGHREEKRRAAPGRPLLDWAHGGYMVIVREGRWSFENVQVGSRRKGQRLGFDVRGPAHLELDDVRIRVASHSGPALLAQRGGLVHLRGSIEINEDFHERVPEGESFAGIAAESHGIVHFREKEGASLSIGNGSLSTGYGGAIRLGCETARVTSWGGQSNCIAVNNTGRVDLHGTTLHLRAVRPSNSPIGLEDDGHVLAEGARIVIECGDGGSGIVLQKASTLYCNDIEMRGKPKYTLLASSGSNFVGGVVGDVLSVHADTGATIHIGRCTGSLKGPFRVSRGGRLSLPDGRVLGGGTTPR